MQLMRVRSPYAEFRCAVGAFFFVQGLVFASWASRIPDIKRFLGLNEAELGGVLFAMPCGQMAAMALSGYLVGKFGSRRMLMLAAVLYPIFLVGLGLAGTVLSLCVLLFGFGVAANMHNIAVNTQAVGVEKLYQRSIMATFHGLWSFAGLVGGIVGALFAGFSLSPFVHFLGILGVVLVVFGVLHRKLLPQDAGTVPKEGAEAKMSTRGRRSFDPTVLLIGIIAFGCMASEGVMYDWSSVYFETVVQAEPQWIRLGYIAFMCLMVCGRFLADGLITRFGVIRLLRGSGLLIAGGFFLYSGLSLASLRSPGDGSRWFGDSRGCSHMLQSRRAVPNNSSGNGYCLGFQYWFFRFSALPAVDWCSGLSLWFASDVFGYGRGRSADGRLGDASAKALSFGFDPVPRASAKGFIQEKNIGFP